MTRPTSAPVTQPHGYPGRPELAAEIIRLVAATCGQALK